MTFDTITPREENRANERENGKRLGQRDIRSTRVVQRLIGEGAVGESQVGADVITTDSTSTLTNKTMDADDNTFSNFAHGSEVDNTSSGVHGVSGGIVGTSDSQALTNKTINAASNTVSNISGNETVAGTFDTDFDMVPFVIAKDVSNSATTTIFNSNAPYKFRVLDAWAVETAAGNSGTWKIDDGTNDITAAVSYSGSDTGLTRADAVDDDNHDVAASGSLRCINSVATDDAFLYILAIRVA